MDNSSNQTQEAQSTFVTSLAWVFIVLSGFITLISIAQNIMISTMFPTDQMHAPAMH